MREALARRHAVSSLRRRGARIHVLPPPVLRTGVRQRALRLLYSGAIVELQPGRGQRVIDVVARDAGLPRPVGPFHASTAGGLVAAVRTHTGERVILRAAHEGWPGDPGASADALAILEGHEISAPRLLARGVAAGASWTLERFVPGTRPRTLDDRVGAALAHLVARFPRTDARPGATLRDLDRIAVALPDQAPGVARLRDRAVTSDTPAIMRHGDLWLGNVLDGADGTFVVDWEGWAPDGMPGADLLHLYATERRIAARTDMGSVLATRPWRDDAYRKLAEPYWATIGWEPRAEDEAAIAIAWWAAEIAGTLARVPERAIDARWISINVEGVLARAME